MTTDTFKSGTDTERDRKHFRGQSNIKHTVQNMATVKTDKKVNFKHIERNFK